MEMANFDPHIEPKPLNRELIISARELPKPNLVQIHPLGASGQMGEIQRFCAYIFCQTRLQVRPTDRFFYARLKTRKMKSCNTYLVVIKLKS